MPFRRASRAPDLERVRQVLDPPNRVLLPPGRWVPDPPEPTAVGGELQRLETDLRRARRPAVLTVPEQLRSGRVSVSSAAVVALLALVLAVGCVFVLRVLWAERNVGLDEPAPGAGSSTPSVVVSGAGSPRSPAAFGSGSGAPAPTVAPALVVYVSGQVRRPGLVRLRSGARVADALAAAGGPRKGADTVTLNLAQPISDGEQVHVPRAGEAVRSPPDPVPTGVGASGSPGGGGVPVDLNRADAATLDTLPGVGPVLAQRILDWRSQHGRFSSVDELAEVSGIGEKMLSQLRARVQV